MTRKDFELIAQAIAGMQDKYTGDDWTINGAMYPFARQLADALESSNPRFDSERFLKACGVTL
jgi:hypothetical protein